MMHPNLTWPDGFLIFLGPRWPSRLSIQHAWMGLVSISGCRFYNDAVTDSYVPKSLVENVYCFNHMHGHFINTLHHFIEYGWFSPVLSIWTNSLFKVCRDPHVLKNSAYQKGADAESDRQPMHWNAFSWRNIGYLQWVFCVVVSWHPRKDRVSVA